MRTRAPLGGRARSCRRGLGLKGPEDPELRALPSGSEAFPVRKRPGSETTCTCPSCSRLTGPSRPGERSSGLALAPLAPLRGLFTCSQVPAGAAPYASVPTAGEHDPAICMGAAMLAEQQLYRQRPPQAQTGGGGAGLVRPRGAGLSARQRLGAPRSPEPRPQP